MGVVTLDFVGSARHGQFLSREGMVLTIESVATL